MSCDSSEAKGADRWVLFFGKIIRQYHTQSYHKFWYNLSLLSLLKAIFIIFTILINYIFRMSLFFIQSKLFFEINFKMLDKKSRIKVLFCLSFLLIPFLIFSIISQTYTNQEEPDYNGDGVKRPKKSGYWDENDVSFIHIDNNWSDAASNLDWVQGGDGSWGSPYVIENITIDAGGSGSGILIENSNDYFIIRNCTVYNSGSGVWDAGIKLESVSNGILINNNFSNNNYRGLYLDYSDNITVSGNNAYSNTVYGIYLWGSVNNTVSGNTANDNTYDGIFLDNSDNNTISGIESIGIINTMFTSVKKRTREMGIISFNK